MQGTTRRVVTCGSIGIYGGQFIRTCGGFDEETVLQYLKELAGHFGKVAIIMYGAPQRKAGIVRGSTGWNPDVRVIWLPTATPELSVVGEYRSRAKRDVPASGRYATIMQMRMAASEYFRTARSGLDAMSFICRRSFDLKNF